MHKYPRDELRIGFFHDSTQSNPRLKSAKDLWFLLSVELQELIQIVELVRMNSEELNDLVITGLDGYVVVSWIPREEVSFHFVDLAVVGLDLVDFGW